MKKPTFTNTKLQTTTAPFTLEISHCKALIFMHTQGNAHLDLWRAVSACSCCGHCHQSTQAIKDQLRSSMPMSWSRGIIQKRPAQVDVLRKNY